MKESRKLTRGLAELSPLFRGKPAPAAMTAAQPPSSGPSVAGGEERQTGGKVMSVFCADSPGENEGLNAFMAFRLAACQFSCSLVTVGASAREFPAEDAGIYIPSYRRNLSRSRLAWESFERLFEAPCTAERWNPSWTRTLILDFGSPEDCPRVEKIIALLDKSIFLVRPTFESLSKTYKMMKSMVSLQPDMECFILFEGEPQDPHASLVFERLAQMASRFLGIHIFWLGCLPCPDVYQSRTSDLSLKYLFMRSIWSPPGPEKMALFDLASGRDATRMTA